MARRVYPVPVDMREGTMHFNNEKLAFVIIKYTNYRNIEVEFLESGTRRSTRADHIRIKQVRDNGIPRVNGVGYFGVGEFNTRKHQTFYTRWHGMIARCYGNYDAYTSYRGVKVCKRWHNFQNFCKDLPLLPGYSDFIENPSKYHLDKDALSPNGCKLYSPHTCCFLHEKENEHYKKAV